MSDRSYYCLKKTYRKACTLGEVCKHRAYELRSSVQIKLSQPIGTGQVITDVNSRQCANDFLDSVQVYNSHEQSLRQSG